MLESPAKAPAKARPKVPAKALALALPKESGKKASPSYCERIAKYIDDNSGKLAMAGGVFLTGTACWVGSALYYALNHRSLPYNTTTFLIVTIASSTTSICLALPKIAECCRYIEKAPRVDAFKPPASPKKKDYGSMYNVAPLIRQMHVKEDDDAEAQLIVTVERGVDPPSL